MRVPDRNKCETNETPPSAGLLDKSPPSPPSKPNRSTQTICLVVAFIIIALLAVALIITIGLYIKNVKNSQTTPVGKFDEVTTTTKGEVVEVITTTKGEVVEVTAMKKGEIVEVTATTTETPWNIPAAAQFDLTEQWKCAEGIYYLRHVGNELWWYAKHPDMVWAHILYGTIKDSVIRARWADVLPGHHRLFGNLTITVDNNWQLRATMVTGGFGCFSWTRA